MPEHIDVPETVELQRRRDQFLNKLISVGDRKDFLAAERAKRLSEFLQSKTQYQLTSARDLDADDEGRLYDENVRHEARIFSLPRLELRNSRSVTFRNCIFLGDLRVGGSDLRKLQFDNCLCMGICNITGIDGAAVEIHIWNSNFRVLRIGSSKIDTLNIGESRAYEFEFFTNQCAHMLAATNLFKRFRFTDNDITKCTFSHKQVDVDLTFGESAKTYMFGGASALQQPLEELSGLLLDFSSMPYEKSLVQLETLSFLKERSTLRFDQTSLSTLRYYSAFLSQSKLAARFVKVTRGFENPLLFVAYAGIVLAGFAALFNQPFCGFTNGAVVILQDGRYQLQDVVSWGLRWPEALYVSGITFATIGYGDITPVGMTRFLAIVEGLLGVTLMSAFVVSLVKRYIER